MANWQPERQTVRMRNGQVVAVTGGSVTLDLDGSPIPMVPVHGPTPVEDQWVTVLEQGSSLLVLGSTTALQADVDELHRETARLRGLVEALLMKVED